MNKEQAEIVDAPHMTPQVLGELESIRGEHGDWVWSFEIADPMVCDSDAIRELYNTAPTPYFKGVIGGILMMRESISLITQRAFMGSDS